MIIKEYQDLDTCNRTRVFVDVECEVCGTIFKRQKRFLKAHTCSARCVKLAKGERIIVQCAHCGKDIEKPQSRLDKSRSGLLFCNRECKELGQQYLKEIQPHHYGTASPETGYRTKAFKHYPHECQLCGYKENKAALVVHHIDHDRSNDDIDNLIILCANCHAITHWA
jgi:hypothetical protein